LRERVGSSEGRNKKKKKEGKIREIKGVEEISLKVRFRLLNL